MPAYKKKGFKLFYTGHLDEKGRPTEEGKNEFFEQFFEDLDCYNDTKYDCYDDNTKYTISGKGSKDLKKYITEQIEPMENEYKEIKSKFDHLIFRDSLYCRFLDFLDNPGIAIGLTCATVTASFATTYYLSPYSEHDTMILCFLAGLAVPLGGLGALQGLDKLKNFNEDRVGAKYSRIKNRIEKAKGFLGLDLEEEIVLEEGPSAYVSENITKVKGLS